MIRIYKAFAWVLGICFVCFSVILLAAAPLGTALPFIALFAFLMTGLILSIRKQASQQPQSTIATESLPRLVLHPGNGVQLLESLCLLETTSNIKTLDSRIAVILNLYDRFIVGSQFVGYRNFAAKEIERYLSLYPDRPVGPMQQQLIVCPDFGALQSFLGRSIYESCVRYAKIQAGQMAALVRPSAKEKRLINFMALRDEFIALYAKYAIPEQDNAGRIRTLSIDNVC